jgi:uncharacterized membrane protein YgcG
MDADGDGHANVFDINDAALSAARYLCVAGGDLRTQAGQLRAVYAYNQTDTYVAQVLALADAYRRGIPISGLPVGNVTGALPPVDPGAVPPANPGPPTANRNTTSSAPKPAGSSAPASKPSTTSGGATGGGSTGGGSTGGSTGGSATPTPTPTPTPSGSTSSTPTPTPSGTRSCVVKDPFNRGHCIIWQTPGA